MAGSPKRPAKVPPAAKTNVSGAAPQGAAAARAVFDVLRRLERFARWGDDDGGAKDWDAILRWPSSGDDAHELRHTEGYGRWEEDVEGNFIVRIFDTGEIRKDDDFLRWAICEHSHRWVGVMAMMDAGWADVRNRPRADRLAFLLSRFPRLKQIMDTMRIERSKGCRRKAVVRQALQEQMPSDLLREAEDFVWQHNGDGRRIRAIEGDEWLDVLTVDHALDELRQALLNHAGSLAQQHQADNQVAQPADNESESGLPVNPPLPSSVKVAANLKDWGIDRTTQLETLILLLANEMKEVTNSTIQERLLVRLKVLNAKGCSTFNNAWKKCDKNKLLSKNPDDERKRKLTDTGVARLRHLLDLYQRAMA